MSTTLDPSTIEQRRQKRQARREREANAPLRNFVVGVKDCPECERTILARSHGRARSECWSAISEVWTDLKITQVYARLASRPPVESSRFRMLKEQRGLPWLKIGMRVTVDGKPGRIADQDAGEMGVIFDGEHSPRACHPTWRVTYFDDAGNVIRAFDDNGR